MKVALTATCLAALAAVVSASPIGEPLPPAEPFPTEELKRAAEARAALEIRLAMANGGAMTRARNIGTGNVPKLDKRTTVSVVYPEGQVNGFSLTGMDEFRGVPFAQSPAGTNRLKPPQRYTTSVGVVDGAVVGPSCPQMFLSSGSGDEVFNLLGKLINIPMFQTITGTDENCLTLNIQRPTGTNSTSKLPVLYWMYGGGFEFGSIVTYDGISLIAHGIDINEPFIFVAVNYRMGGFGFLAGKEIKAAGASNLGLLDQRMGLEWVADNIEAFGGDPDRVTIWGESSGAISVFDQMALYGGDNTYKGKPLFHGAIMDSGSVVPASPVDGTKGQAIYDKVVEAGGCKGSADTLECLRGLPYDKYLDAATSVPGIFSYNSVALSYLPRPDGTVLTDSPDVLVKNKQYAAVPMIIGDQEDEGTVFAIMPHVTNTEGLVKYFKSLYFIDASESLLRGLVNTYSTSITAGSPFRTGIFWELYPGFKRLAAILGDITFTLTRRCFLKLTNEVNPDVPSWSYLSSYYYGIPFLGTCHASDVLQVFYGILPNYASGAIQTYYINFVTTGDPNKGASVKMPWPQWSKDNNLMNFFADRAALLADNFRQTSYQYLLDHMDSFRI